MNNSKDTVVKPRVANNGSSTRLMKIIRRTHMFTGLFMLPWVLMYGLSALVFNHNSWFFSNAKPNQASAQSRGTRSLPESFWSAGPLTDVESAESLARGFLEQVNQEQSTNKASQWRLAGDDAARFSRALVLEGSDHGEQMELQMNLDDRAGNIVWRSPGTNNFKTKSAPAQETRRFQPADGFTFDDDWLAGVSAACGKLEQTTNSPAIKLRVKNAPELLFNAEADGRTWNVRCNLNSGEMIAREAGTGGSFVGSTAGFIKKLHMARGYPVVGKLSIRWWWAVIVDGMASLMLLWGLSGLAMWWQMKGQRKWGAVTLFACAFVTWLVWTGMQHALR